VKVLLSLSALSTGMYGGSTLAPNSLGDYDIPQLLQDFVHRFDSEDGLVEVLGPVVIGLLFHPSLFREEGLAASDPQWRGVLTGLEALVAQKQIAIMITKMDEWNPVDATAVTFETTSLMGPLLRLNVFSREWVRDAFMADRHGAEANFQPYITKMYFSNVETRPAADVESSRSSLRGTLKSLQVKCSCCSEFCVFIPFSPRCFKSSTLLYGHRPRVARQCWRTFLVLYLSI
jgi:ubiquitin conjugation factor E4 B